MIGITSYGFYVPRYRISIQTLADTWKRCASKMSSSLKVTEKAVAGQDEDILTMAYEASAMAFENCSSIKKQIGAVFVGSETFPYAVKPTSTGLAQWLGLSHHYLSYDTQFACKAGTGALISATEMVRNSNQTYALVAASDKANAKPQDALEYTASSGANAWIVGSDNVAVEILNWSSYSSDTPDFWRRSKAEFPSHASRFTGEPAYFHHITESSRAVLKQTDMQPKDFAHAVFHMPNGSFPLRIAKQLGFSQTHMAHSYVVPVLGNSYSASALMGLVAVLEHAKEGEYIFFASYGSGAGSDAIIFRCTAALKQVQRQFSASIKQKEYIDYPTYINYMEML